MRQNKLIAVMSTVFAICLMATSAWAIDRVEVKVTSEPIPRVVQCSKAGGFSLEFDSQTTLEPGDVIKIDLPNYFNGDQVTLCKNIDFVVSQGAGAAYDTTTATWNLNGTGWAAVPLQVAGQENPFVYPATTAANAAPNATGNSIIFHVKGSNGGDRITITVIGAAGDTLQVGTDGDAKLILKLFDLKDNDGDVDTPAFSNPGIWEDADGDGVYDEALDGNDNALCIDVFDGDTPKGETTVFKANMDSDDLSGNDKFTFIPSDPQIAHIKGSSEYELFPCKGAKADNIPMPEEGQNSTSCAPFDYESGAGYCTAANLGRRIVIKRNTAFSASEKFGVRLQIVSPSEVYWGAAGVGYNTMATPTCTIASADTLTATATDANGNAVTEFATGGTCTVTSDQDAKTLTTAFGIGFANETQTAIYVDMPQLVYTSAVSEGDTVQVEVSLLKQPCGEIFTTTIDLGTFGCQNTASDALLFPYFTNMADGDGWWDGIVITNLASFDGTATIAVYEADGDRGEQEVAVKANSQYVSLLNTILGDFSMTATAGSGQLGDSSAYIMVTTDFNADGFAMMGDGTQAQGYLPRD
ncbi:hypothetical protein DENIS_1154 [Desulfonema ishimotonii]|uniref:Big-1 domain-containing protein n=2 Tax=Desulfonema ishimotonii TaxID=45657 RepID=A0A401FTC1_9BACT|nr:hypothetical protein DENIS_1154 [Desulfonema ishimotonii]